eukprot:SAG11_NODE_13375_length_658_cov_0.749553_1_plen_171_part_10
MVARTRVRVTSRFTRVLNILASSALFHRRGEGGGTALPPLDRPALQAKQYAASGAAAAEPDRSDRSSTPWTTSDIFFLGHALGRLSVHKGTVRRLRRGAAVVALAGGGEAGLRCDAMVKNLGFEGVDVGEKARRPPVASPCCLPAARRPPSAADVCHSSGGAVEPPALDPA